MELAIRALHQAMKHCQYSLKSKRGELLTAQDVVNEIETEIAGLEANIAGIAAGIDKLGASE